MPKSIDDTFSVYRKYVIPRFQREYSWEGDELTTMFEDLIENINFIDGRLEPNEYFIGSLVLVGDEDDTTQIERYIVDGQQRLTTITIAFAVLAQKFLEIEEETLQRKIHLNVMGEDTDGNPYPKLVNENPKPFFQRRIQRKEIDLTAKPSTAEEKRLLAAYDFFEKKLSEKVLIETIKEHNPIATEFSYKDALKSFRDQLLKCKVIYVTVKSLDDAYTIFEVLNAKGKNLSATDMIKNSLLSVLTTDQPDDEALDRWKQAKAYINDAEQDFDVFFRHFWISKYCKTTVEKLSHNFQKHISTDIASYSAFLRLLEDEACTYGKICNPTKAEWSQPEDLFVYTSLNAFKIFNTTQVRIILIALLDARGRHIISHKMFKYAILYLEHFHFVFTAVCSSRPSGLESRYASYARKLRKVTIKEEASALVRNMIDDLKTSIPSEDAFKEKFLQIKYTDDYQRTKKLVQYILLKLESYYSTGEVKPNSFTIEHIMPQATKGSHVGMVGNLLPLGAALNGESATKPIDQKLVEYGESQYMSVKAFVGEHADATEWGESEIQERTIDIATLLYNEIIED